MLTIHCPHCHTVYKIGDEMAERKARCAKCGGIFVVHPALYQGTALQELGVTSGEGQPDQVSLQPPYPPPDPNAADYPRSIFSRLYWWLIGGLAIALCALLWIAISNGRGAAGAPNARERESYPDAAKAICFEIQLIQAGLFVQAANAKKSVEARLEGDERQANIAAAEIGFAYDEIRQLRDRSRAVLDKIREMPEPPPRFQTAHNEIIEASIRISKVGASMTWSGNRPPSLFEYKDFVEQIVPLTDSLTRIDLLLSVAEDKAGKP